MIGRMAMAFIIYSAKGEELGRRQLDGPTVIGRAADCDIAVRDILLSRRHCQIEATPAGWFVEDLASKNGTRVNGEAVIARRMLNDGDVLKVGKTTIRFHRGRLAVGNGGVRRPDTPRPLDPHEALAQTVSDFDSAEVLEFQQKNNLPSPKPVPREPAAFAREDIYSLLSEITSSSWDSIYEQASKPRSEPVKAAVAAPPDPRRGRRREWDCSLHVTEAPVESPRRIPRPKFPEMYAPKAITPSPVAKAPPPQAGWFRRALRPIGAAFEHVRQWGAMRLF